MEHIIAALGDYEVTHLYKHCLVCFILFIITAIFCILDFISGTRTARVLGEKLRSHRFRKSIEKMTWYWLFQLLGFFFGLMGTIFEWYDWPYISIAIAIAIGLIEGKSMFEHAKRRKCQTAKIPETIRELVDWIGEDKLKGLIENIVTKHKEV